MRKCVFILGLIVLACNSFGQRDKNPVISEILISVNKTMVSDYNTEDRWGFGLGVSHAFLPAKVLNVMFGAEYNHVRQFKYTAFSGRMFHIYDLTYMVNSISIPLGVRINAGKNAKVFIETGGFTDISVHSRRKGTQEDYHIVPNEIYEIITTSFNNKIGLKPSVGLYIGAGLRIAIFRYELIIKSDYKHGLNNMDFNPDNLKCSYVRLAVGLKFN